MRSKVRSFLVNKKMLERLVCGICTLTLIAGSFSLPVYGATGVNVESHTPKEIHDYIANSGAQMTDSLTFAEEPLLTEPYALGKLSDSTLNSALATVNQIRYIAGVSHNVTLDAALSQQVQAAAVANYANGKLSHTPEKPVGMSNEMYQLAKIGAGSANIAMASWQGRSLNETLFKGWMNDGDSSNISCVGHRRWLINPALGKVGFGAATGSRGTYSAVSVFDTSNTSAKQYGVMWPAQNMPLDYFDTTFPWSISMGTNVNITTVKVKLVRQKDGKTWNFSNTLADGEFYVNNDLYGQKGCIIFRPKMENGEKYNDGDVFDVTITGVSSGTVSYSVHFFSLHTYKDTIVKPTCTEKGYTEHKCIYGNESYRTNYVDAIGHQYEGTITREPTTELEGIKTYTCANCGKQYTEVIPKPEQQLQYCGDDITWRYDSSTATLHITGSGDMYDYNTVNYYYSGITTDVPWEDYLSKIRHVKFAGRINYIGKCILSDATLLQDIVWPDGVKEIGDSAFARCTSLVSVEFPQTITKLGEGTVAGCTSLKHVILPENISSIPKMMFSGCSQLDNIILPKTIVSIGESAFNMCKNLSAITLPEGLEEIKFSAFFGCSNLLEIKIPYHVKELGAQSFELCTDLKKVIIESPMIEIGKYIGTHEVFDQYGKGIDIYCLENSTAWDYFTYYGISCKPLSLPENKINVVSTGYDGVYDGTKHSISVKVEGMGSGEYQIYYSKYDTLFNNYYNNTLENISVSSAGTTTIHYYVCAKGYQIFHGTEDIIIHKAMPTLKFEKTDVEIKQTDKTYKNNFTSNSDGKVTYVSDDTDVATVDSNGKITVNGSGECNIIANVAEGINYSATSTSYHLTVTPYKALKITQQPENNIKGKLGQKFVLHVEAEGEGLTYEWRFDSTWTPSEKGYSVIPGTSPDLTVMLCEDTSGACGGFWCHVTDKDGNSVDTQMCNLWAESSPEYKAFGVCGENIEWSIDNDGVMKISGTGDILAEDIAWREYLKGVNKLVIEEGITTIGDNAFAEALNLFEIHVNSHAPILGKNVFRSRYQKVLLYHPKNAKGYDVSPWCDMEFVNRDEVIGDTEETSGAEITTKPEGSSKPTETIGKTEQTTQKRENIQNSNKVKKPSSTTIKSIKRAKKSLKITWKEIKSVKGYQIQYSTSSKFKKAKKVTIRKAKTTSKTIKKLQTKKKYYVRIRTYIMVNGKKKYSSWSKKKSAKTK